MIDLKIGDVFGVSNPRSVILGKGIRAFEKFHSKDGKAKYGHSGIITSRFGNTFEALMKVREQNIWTDYIDNEIIIARPITTMDGATINIERRLSAVADLMKDYRGDWYPGWRLLLFTLGAWLPKHVHMAGKPVCSELVAKYLALIDARYDSFWGVMPDTLADEWHIWNNFNIVYEGILTKDLR